MADLSRYKKDDLIFIINRSLSYAVPFDPNYYIEKAIVDLQYEKDLARISEAEEYGNLADKKRAECVNLLQPYAGVAVIDIPHGVLAKADALMREAQEADKRFMELLRMDEKEAQ